MSWTSFGKCELDDKRFEPWVVPPRHAQNDEIEGSVLEQETASFLTHERAGEIRAASWAKPLRHNVPKITAAVEAAQSLLDLTDEDGNLIVERAVLRRATSFLLTFARHALESQRLRIEPPVIGPGPDGSVDLNWRCANFSLLINIPADTSSLATYYGRNPAGESAEGSFSTERHGNWGQLLWLMQTK